MEYTVKELREEELAWEARLDEQEESFIETLKRYEVDGLIKSQTHPNLPLIVWNYTDHTQYNVLWDDITLMCRGLVTDFAGNIVSKSFDKFFNYSELKDGGLKGSVPKEPFTVFEKLDGSLINLFNFNGEWIVASKGSFTSDVANMAKGIFGEDFDGLDERYTYSFELTGKDNRIVVEYPYDAKLTLIGVFDDLGKECDLEGWGFDVVKTFNIAELDELHDLIPKGHEGFVIKFTSGKRMKIKSEEYIHLHKIVTQISSIDIWEVLRSGGDFSQIIGYLPDEWYAWFDQQRELLKWRFDRVRGEMAWYFLEGVKRGLYKRNKEPIANRKEIAEYFLRYEYPSLLFNYLDSKPIDDKIWALVKPNHERGFSI